MSERSHVGRLMRSIATAGPRTWALMLAGFAFVVRLPLMVVAHDASARDTFDYFKIADGLHHGRLLIDGIRTPGYPVLIFLLDLLPGRREDALIIFQHLLGVAVVAAIVIVAWRYFGRGPAIVAAALAAATPVMVGSEHAMVPDFLFGVVVCGGALLLVEAIIRPGPSWRWFLAAGLAFGLSAFIKPTGLFLIAAAPLALLLSRSGVRYTLRASALVMVALMLTIAPWVVRNGLVLGHWTMSIQGGETLFHRVFDVDHRPVPTDTAEGQLVHQFQREKEAQRSKDELYAFVSGKLHDRGYSTYGIVALERRVAIRAVKAAPAAYAAGTANSLGRFMLDTGNYSASDLSNDEATNGLGVEKRHGLVKVAARDWIDVTRALNLVWMGLALGGAAMLLPLAARSKRKRFAAAAFVAVWLCVAFGTAASHGALRRYSAEVAPLVWIAGSAGAAIVLTATRSTLRRAIARSPFFKRTISRLQKPGAARAGQAPLQRHPSNLSP
jgi:4-amino-4-deoxy-L-arabinose transferase-like glycosyltransferase